MFFFSHLLLLTGSFLRRSIVLLPRSLSVAQEGVLFIFLDLAQRVFLSSKSSSPLPLILSLDEGKTLLSSLALMS